MKANGMLGMMAAVKSLLGGRYFWMTSVTTPIAKAAATAPASDVRRATTTAANAAAIKVVIPTGDKPLVGATSTPASPASVALTAHTPTETRFGLVPDSEVIASESTIARTRKPMSVKRSTAVPAKAMKTRNP